MVIHSNAFYLDAGDTGTPVNQAHAGLEETPGPPVFIKPVCCAVVVDGRNSSNDIVQVNDNLKIPGSIPAFTFFSLQIYWVQWSC